VVTAWWAPRSRLTSRPTSRLTGPLAAAAIGAAGALGAAGGGGNGATGAAAGGGGSGAAGGAATGPEPTEMAGLELGTPLGGGMLAAWVRVARSRLKWATARSVSSVSRRPLTTSSPSGVTSNRSWS
jgi:hypothetical protein